MLGAFSLGSVHVPPKSPSTPNPPEPSRRFVQQAKDFTYAIVRGAGHIVPYDQGEKEREEGWEGASGQSG